MRKPTGRNGREHMSQLGNETVLMEDPIQDFLLSLAITCRFSGSVRIRNAFSCLPRELRSPSGFSVSHVSLLIATPQKSRSSRLSDDPRGAQNSFGNESPAVYIPVSSDKFHLAH